MIQVLLNMFNKKKIQKLEAEVTRLQEECWERLRDQISKSGEIRELKELLKSTATHCTAVLLTRGGKVLLTKRSSKLTNFPTLWCIPGGKVDEGEDLLSAGVRELKEEVGVQLIREALDFIHTIEVIGTDSKVYKVHVYKTSLFRGEPYAVDFNEVSECKWVTPEEALDTMELAGEVTIKTLEGLK